MKNEDTKILMSLYKSLKSDKMCKGDLDKILDITTKLMHLTKCEILIEDAVSTAVLAEARFMKISLCEGGNSFFDDSVRNSFFDDSVRNVNVLLNFEELVDGTKDSGWVGYHNISGLFGGSLDDGKENVVRTRLRGMSLDWAEDVEGFWSVLEIPFKIYKDNPGKTMAQAKKSIFSSDERRMLESLERSDVLAKGKSRKAFC